MANERQYIDFKLYLASAPDETGACQVSLLPTPEVGESTLPVIVPIEKKPADFIRWDLEDKFIALHELIILGKSLTDCLLPIEGGIREAFKQAYEIAGMDGGVRLRLIIADHELKAWPWEYFYLNLLDGPDSMAGFLALNGRISIIRHEPLPHKHPIMRTPAADQNITNLRMVIATALPHGQAELNLAQEVQNIKEAVEGFAMEGVKLTLEPEIESATPRDIERLPQGTYIFHFAGHGVVEKKQDKAHKDGGDKREGALVLVKDKTSGQEARMRANDVATALQRAGVRLAFLGACQTGERDENYPWDTIAGALTAYEIPAVLTMQHRVADQAAIAFSEAFYAALAVGLSLDEAMFAGRRATLLELTTDPSPEMKVPIEWGVPVLYSRLPDGQLFPERMQNAGDAAREFRKVINQSVNLVDTDGNVMGVRAALVKSGFQLNQKLGIVKGKATGAIIGTLGEEAELEVNQEADTVSGTLTGAVFDEL